MPSITIRVRSVLPRTVGYGRDALTKHDVLSEGAGIFETFSQLKASLCERASVQGFPVRIVWKDSRWGREIVHVEKATEVAA